MERFVENYIYVTSAIECFVACFWIYFRGASQVHSIVKWNFRLSGKNDYKKKKDFRAFESTKADGGFPPVFCVIEESVVGESMRYGKIFHLWRQAENKRTDVFHGNRREAGKIFQER